MKVRTWVAGLALGCAFDAKAEIVSAVTASSGLILTTGGGYKPINDTITKNFDVRWLSFRSRVLALTQEFQFGISNEFSITQIMETRVGLNLYPFAFGADFEDFHENSSLRYTASLKPYFLSKIGYGRYLLAIVDSLGAAEVSSNYISLAGGIGTHYSFTQNIALDANVDASMILGISEVAFSGFMLRPRFGLLLYL